MIGHSNRRATSRIEPGPDERDDRDGQPPPGRHHRQRRIGWRRVRAGGNAPSNGPRPAVPPPHGRLVLLSPRVREPRRRPGAGAAAGHHRPREGATRRRGYRRALAVRRARGAARRRLCAPGAPSTLAPVTDRPRRSRSGSTRCRPTTRSRRAPALAGDTDVDVAIVGAGLHRPVDRLYLLGLDPDAAGRVVLEAEVAGFGASGRNGGWCSALLPMSFDHGGAAPGSDGALAMQRAMFDTVDEVGGRPPLRASTATTPRAGTSTSPPTPPTPAAPGRAGGGSPLRARRGRSALARSRRGGRAPRAAGVLGAALHAALRRHPPGPPGPGPGRGRRAARASRSTRARGHGHRAGPGRAPTTAR